MKIILETERLILREMMQEDYPALAAILMDEQTMYAYECVFSESETQMWLDRNLTRYREEDIGLWAVILKDNGLMIGQCGLTWQEVSGRRVPEVGYLLNRAYWGNNEEELEVLREQGYHMNSVLGKAGLEKIYEDQLAP